MKKIIGKTVLILGFWAGSVWAKPFTVGNATCLLNNPVCTASLPNINAQLKDVEAMVNDNLPQVDAKRYATGMGNSIALASKGLTVDYGSQISLGLLGGGLGFALDPGDKGLSGLESGALPAGIGGQVSFLAGLNLGLLPIPNLGPIDWKKGIVFVNFLSANLPKLPNSEVEFDGTTFNIGAHVRYKLIDRFNYTFGLFEWTGVDVTSGLNYTSFKLTMKYKVKEDFNEDLGSGNKMVGSYNTNFIFGPDIGIFNIPIEASTGIKVLWVLRLYGGLGIDINFGYSNIKLDAPGDLTADFVQGTSVVDTISAPTNLNLGGESRADILALRTFGGFQLDFAVFNIFVQANFSPTANTYGLAYGARFYY